MTDVGLSHIALLCRNPVASAAFYDRYAGMRVVHRRRDPDSGHQVIWLSDGTRPFVVVLIEAEQLDTVLGPIAHLGVGCASRADVDRLAAAARREGVLAREPEDSGPPVGYWALLRDPDGHILELSYGQEVGLTVREADSVPK